MRHTRVVALVVMAALAVAALWADTTMLTEEQSVSDTVNTGDVQPVGLGLADSGSAYCPPLAADGQNARVELSVIGAAAEVEVLVDAKRIDSLQMTPGSTTVVELPPGPADAGVTVRSAGAPVIATYSTVGDGPQVSLRCAPTTEARWHLAGFDTRLGNDATLHLFNPFSVDAVARVGFATPEGQVDLVTTAELAVPAGKAVAVDIDEVQPEIADLGAVVDVVLGRVVASGEMRFGPPDEDTPTPSGRTAIEGVAEPSMAQLFAYGSSSPPGQETWLSVMNPDPDRESIVLTTVSNADPNAAVNEEVTIPPRGTIRIQTEGLSERRTFGSAVTVLNEVGVVATRFVARTDTEATSVAAAAAVPAATEWIVLGGTTANADSVVDIFNFGGDPAIVDVAPMDSKLDAPSAWPALAIDPNGQLGLPLSELGRQQRNVPVRVTSSAPVVASVRSAVAEGAAADFMTTVGFTESTWLGLSARPQLRYDPRLDAEPVTEVTPSP